MEHQAPITIELFRRRNHGSDAADITEFDLTEVEMEIALALQLGRQGFNDRVDVEQIDRTREAQSIARDRVPDHEMLIRVYELTIAPSGHRLPIALPIAHETQRRPLATAAGPLTIAKLINTSTLPPAAHSAAPSRSI